MTRHSTNVPFLFGLFICLSLICPVAAETEWVIGIGALNTPNLEHVCGDVTFRKKCGSAADKPCNALVKGWSPDACRDFCVLKLMIKPRVSFEPQNDKEYEIFVRPIGALPESERERQFMSPELKLGDNVLNRKLDILLEPKTSMIFCKHSCICMWSRCTLLESPNNMVACPSKKPGGKCDAENGALYNLITNDMIDWAQCSADDEYLSEDCPFEVRALADFGFHGYLSEAVNCPTALKILDEEKSKNHQIMAPNTCWVTRNLVDDSFLSCGHKDNPCPVYTADYGTRMSCGTCLIVTVEIPGCDIWNGENCLPVEIQIYARIAGPILNEDVNMSVEYALPWKSLEGNIIRHAMMTNDSALEDKTIQRTAKHFSKVCTAENSKMYLKGRDQAYEDVNDCVVQMHFGNDYERAKMIAKKFQNQEFFGVNVEACA